jgi:hypothetical protein
VATIAIGATYACNQSRLHSRRAAFSSADHALDATVEGAGVLLVFASDHPSPPKMSPHVDGLNATQSVVSFKPRAPRLLDFFQSAQD